MSHSKSCWWLHRDCLCNTCQRDKWPDCCCVERGKRRQDGSCCVSECEAYLEEPWEDISRNASEDWLIQRLRNMAGT